MFEERRRAALTLQGVPAKGGHVAASEGLLVNQMELFADDRYQTPSEVHTDPHLPDEAKSRLGGQNAAILERLRQGSAINMELEECSNSKRVNSRIADVRRWLRQHENRTIATTAIDTARGIYRYEIQ